LVRWHRNTGLGIFLQLVAKGPDRDAQDRCSMGPVSETVVQGVDDQMLFDLGDGQADKAAQAYNIVEMKKNEEWDRIQRQMPDSFQMTVSTHVTSQNRSW
jgi:hypothetical protein